jgi:hypothetical protein
MIICAVTAIDHNLAISGVCYSLRYLLCEDYALLFGAFAIFSSPQPGPV